MAFGERLREERLKLGLSQQEMGESCGSSRRSQINYEAEVGNPGTDYWIKADALGVDVAYVITGTRVKAKAVAESRAEYLQPNERELEVLKAWRALDETQKRVIETTIRAFNR